MGTAKAALQGKRGGSLGARLTVNAAMLDIVRNDRPQIPAGAITAKDYQRIHPEIKMNCARDAMRALAKKHGWKSARHDSTVYYWP